MGMVMVMSRFILIDVLNGIILLIRKARDIWIYMPMQVVFGLYTTYCVYN